MWIANLGFQILKVDMESWIFRMGMMGFLRGFLAEIYRRQKNGAVGDWTSGGWDGDGGGIRRVKRRWSVPFLGGVGFEHHLLYAE